MPIIVPTQTSVFANRNVYILGAGFSRPAGFPLVNDFMFQMRDAMSWHESQGHSRAVEAISNVLRFRLNASASAYRIKVDLENVEDLFSLASASGEDLDAAMRVAIASTIMAAQARAPQCKTQFRSSTTPAFSHPANWISRNAEGRRYWEVPTYDFFCRTMLSAWGNSNVAPADNTFVTFNYDQLVERALDSIGISYSYGVKSLDESRGTAPDAIRILKLHGSVNWAVAKGKRTELSTYPDPHSIIDGNLTPELLPPTWRKDALSAFNQIWRSALDAIAQATRLVVIGFSMPNTDQHFRYLLAAGLSKNISLREIVFIDPNEQVVRERARNLFANQEHNAARVKFYSSSVEQMFSQGTQAPAASINRELPREIQEVSTVCVTV